MKRIALLAALSASALAMSAGQSLADYELTILHINDWHSRIESINAFDSTCSNEDEEAGECFGGAARLVTAIDQRRDAMEGENVLLLNGGDNFQGSLFYTTYKGEAEAEFMNRMGFDAMTVGNHEFDDGEDALVPFLEKVEFPVLSANVAPGAESMVGDMIQPSVVIELGGEKIGIVGAVTTDTPEISSPGPHIDIEDDVATITAEVERLEAEGVDKIIALTHVGYPRDKEAIARIPGVDVVVGGHSHSLLSNSDPDAEGPYPTMIDNPEGYQVPVTQAASYSKYLGEFTVTFDDNGVVTAASGEPILIDDSIERDAAVLERVEELKAPIEEVMQEVVAETTAPVDGSRESCRSMECEMGVLVTDAMLARSADQGTTIAITNGGGLRASIDAGEVTMGEVVAVLPFQNTLATFQIAGEHIVEALEGGVSQIEEGAGRFPQIAGLRFTLDTSVPQGEGRVSNVEVGDNGTWIPIDPAEIYTVATNNFMRNGGDGYALFASNAQNAYDYGPGLEQVVADYLAENTPYTPGVEGRITLAQAEPAAEEEEVPAEEVAPPEESAPAEESAPEAEADPAEAASVEQTAPVEAAPTEEAAPVEEAAEEPAATQETADPIEAAPSEEMAPEEEADPIEAVPADEVAPAEAAAPEEAAEPTEAAPTEDVADPDEAAPATQTYTVAPGDSLWNIAEEVYGDGSMWLAIAEANPGIDPDRLPVGATLTLPPAR